MERLAAKTPRKDPLLSLPRDKVDAPLHALNVARLRPKFSTTPICHNRYSGYIRYFLALPCLP